MIRTAHRRELEQIPGKIVMLVLGGAVLIAALAVTVEALMLTRARPAAQLRSSLPREATTGSELTNAQLCCSSGGAFMHHSR
jgi:hypothetical protein